MDTTNYKTPQIALSHLMDIAQLHKQKDNKTFVLETYNWPHNHVTKRL
jgi:hypothetical protein